MRVVVIGATGTIGSAVADLLERQHDVVRASRHGDPAVDLEDPATIDLLFAAVPDLDAVVCCAASAALTPLVEVTGQYYLDAVRGKLIGQVHLVHAALQRISDGGSVTLTSGQFDHAMPGAALGASLNAALETFVATAAWEAPRGVRLNVASPGWVAETLQAMGQDPADGTPAAEVAELYARVVSGSMTGEVVTR